MAKSFLAGRKLAISCSCNLICCSRCPFHASFPKFALAVDVLFSDQSVVVHIFVGGNVGVFVVVRSRWNLVWLIRCWLDWAMLARLVDRNGGLIRDVSVAGGRRLVIFFSCRHSGVGVIVFVVVVIIVIIGIARVTILAGLCGRVDWWYDGNRDFDFFFFGVVQKAEEKVE